MQQKAKKMVSKKNKVLCLFKQKEKVKTSSDIIMHQHREGCFIFYSQDPNIPTFGPVGISGRKREAIVKESAKELPGSHAKRTHQVPSRCFF